MPGHGPESLAVTGPVLSVLHWLPIEVSSSQYDSTIQRIANNGHRTMGKNDGISEQSMQKKKCKHLQSATYPPIFFLIRVFKQPEFTSESSNIAKIEKGQPNLTCRP